MSDGHLRAGMRSAYDAGAAAWAGGPARVYARLAEALIEAAPRALDGCRALDLGAGTGVASAALQRRGAEPVGVDLSASMLLEHGRRRPPGAVGDAHDLPFAAGAFDAVVAACCLNHVTLDGPLSECRRVTRRGGFLLASSFPAVRPHPAKGVVEDVLVQHGWEPPAWYSEFRARIAPLTGDGDQLAAAAGRAGFRDVATEVLEVDLGDEGVGGVVEWRLSMPHTITFVEGLDPTGRRALAADARDAVEDAAATSAIALLVLVASG